MLTCFLLNIMFANLKDKDIFISIYILGLLSNGSFMIVQYTIFFTMIYIIDNQNRCDMVSHKIYDYEQIKLNKIN